ncbi:MAG: TonB-dependent receptor [Bacteroidales bacterium]|nr:TonB-dependent receptor [Bacteroidales bacterium]
MKKIVFVVVILLTNMILYSQKVEISGQIKDEITKNPMEFVYVFTFNAADSMVVSSVTDEDGYFNLSLDKGAYKFVFSQFGYMPDTTDLLTLTESKFLDVYKLSPDENMLDEITVEGESYMLKIDKDVKIVTSEMKNGAANTYDVLDKIGGLHFDRYNNKITVDNDDNIIIIVNGVEKDADYIKNLDPDRLQKVEIIRDPSGKYALEGYTAVINVVLKSNYKGTDLFLSTFNISMPFQPDVELFPFGYNNASLNITQRKINVYLGYSLSYSQFQIKNTKIQKYGDTMFVEYLVPANQLFNAEIFMMNHNVNAGVDYYLSPKNTFSYEASGTFSPLEGNRNLGGYNVLTTIDSVQINDFNTSTLSKSGSKTFNNSVFYVGNYNDKNSLNVSYTFSVYQSETQNFLTQESYETIQHGEDSKQYSTFNTEFNHNFSKKVGVNIGYGNTWKILDNNYIYNYGTIDESSQSFGYQELRNQFYTYFSYSPFDKFSVKLGMATENTIVSYDNIKKPYWIYQPHVDIRFNIPQYLDIKLKYRSSSKYPTISQTNPFTTIVDFQTISTGNPDLAPEVEQKFSTKINVMGGLLSLEPYYNFSNNAIIEVLDIQDNGIWQLSYDNAAKRTEYGIKAGLTLPLGPIIFQNYAWFFKDAIDFNGEKHDLKDWVMSSNLLYMNKKYKTMFGLFYQNQLRKHLTWQGYVTWGNDFWGLFFQQPLMNEKLNIMIIYALPLEWGVSFDQGSYTETSLYKENNFVDLNVIKNMILFQVSYRFSKGKEVRKLDKNLNLEQETEQKKIF